MIRQVGVTVGYEEYEAFEEELRGVLSRAETIFAHDGTVNFSEADDKSARVITDSPAAAHLAANVLLVSEASQQGFSRTQQRFPKHVGIDSSRDTRSSCKA